MTKKLKDITIDEVIAICDKRAFCNEHDTNCQLYVDSFGGCIFRNIHRILAADRNEYYNEHKNDLVTFDYNETNNDGGISW